MRTGIVRLAVEAGVGRRDSNVIGVASRELRERKFWLVCLLEEAKEEAKLQVKVLLCLQGKRSSLVDLQGHKCLRVLLGGPQATEGQEN